MLGGSRAGPPSRPGPRSRPPEGFLPPSTVRYPPSKDMTDFWNDLPEVKRRLEAVSAEMSATVRSAGFPLAEELTRVVESDGKMLRPGFLLLASEFGRPGRADELAPLAAAIELLHIDTLIHDDILDESPLRRGEPAFHVRNGVKEAVLTGDWLFSQCFRLASGFSTPENARRFALVVGIVCSSEIRQDLDKYRYSKSVRDYLRKIAGKTAALFSLAFTLGAVEGGCDPWDVNRLRRTGYNIGMAFQVIDDILDCESTEGVFRKPVGKDVSEGLCTLPLILALERDDGSLLGMLKDPPFDRGTIDRILERIRDSGALETSRLAALRYTERALREIAALPDKPARLALRRLTERLLVRAY